eukprot:m.161104 g.161104  ORF g.161104 m.161104 type:complete len:183 (+) comp18047_c1_seq1:159-707(+)
MCNLALPTAGARQRPLTVLQHAIPSTPFTATARLVIEKSHRVIGPSPTSVRRTKEPCMGRRKSITGGMSLNIQYDVPTTPAQWSETSESIFKSPVVPQPTSRPSTGVNVSTHPRQDFTAFLHRAHNQNTTTWIKTPPRSEVTDAPPDITSPRERTASGTASTSANSVVSPSATRARNKASFV